MPGIVVQMSLTELPAFRRLVQLLEDVENLARVNADEELQSLVDWCYADLAAGCPRQRGH